MLVLFSDLSFLEEDVSLFAGLLSSDFLETGLLVLDVLA